MNLSERWARFFERAAQDPTWTKVVDSPRTEPKGLSLKVARVLLTATVIRFSYGKAGW